MAKTKHAKPTLMSLGQLTFGGLEIAASLHLLSAQVLCSSLHWYNFAITLFYDDAQLVINIATHEATCTNRMLPQTVEKPQFCLSKTGVFT